MSEVSFPTRTSGASTATAGKDYLIYVNTGASEELPTWTLVGGQKEGSLNRSADSLDATYKGTGWKSTLAGMRSWSIDLETIYLKNDAGAKFLEAAFNAGKQIHLKFEHPDKSYITGWGSLTSCNLTTPHDGTANLSGTIEGDGPLSDLQPSA